MNMKNRRLAFVFIVITLVIDAMGIGLILPVMPDLITDISKGTLGDAALWGGIMATVFAVMQFLFGPVLGALSDRFGRRPVLLISLAIMAVDYVVMGLAHAMWMLIVLRIIAGIVAATQSTATAFIADISKPEEKAANFGILGAAFGIGFVLGPLIGGVLGQYDFRAPFYGAAALATMNLTLGYFVLPETVTDRIRRPFEWQRANPVGAFMQVGLTPGMTRFLLIFFLYEFAFFVYPATWAYFTKARFGWDAGMIGLSLGLFGIAMAVVQGALIRPALRIFGEVRTILFGFIFNAGVFVFLGLVTNPSTALIMAPISAFGAIVIPTLQGIMSKRTNDREQGELQGVITSVRSIAIILSPLVMTTIFFWFTREGATIYLPGAAFLLSAGLVLVCLGVFVTRGRAG